MLQYDQSKILRVWIPSVVNVHGFPPRRSQDPFEGRIGTAKFPNKTDSKGKPFEIVGEKYLDMGVGEEKDLAIYILKHPGNIRYDKNNAIACGLLEGETPIEAPKLTPKFVLPDLDTMSKQELREYAGENKINIDIRANKAEIQAAIEAWVKEQKG